MGGEFETKRYSDSVDKFPPAYSSIAIISLQAFFIYEGINNNGVSDG